LGRSRGRYSTKVHLVGDTRCRPIARRTTAGQRGDSPQFIPLIGAVHIPRRGPGRPSTRPAWVLANKPYSSRANRGYLRQRRITAVIPEREDQKANRRNRDSAGGRPTAFDAESYKQHNTAERRINKLKGYRAAATCYDKRQFVYQGTLDVAAIRIWLRDPVT
jgi:transposase